MPNIFAAVIVIAFVCAFDIAAIAVGATFQTACGVCSYGGIAFDMAVYLLVGGCVGLILIGLAIFSVFAEHKGSAMFLLALNGLFALAWGVVGAVLLGSTSGSPCAARCYSVYVMSIIYVIILLLRGAAACCGANNQRE